MGYHLIFPATKDSPAEYDAVPEDPIRCALCYRAWSEDSDRNPCPTRSNPEGYAIGPDGEPYCAQDCLAQAEIAYLRRETETQLIVAVRAAIVLATEISFAAREADNDQEDNPAAVLNYALECLLAYAAGRDSGFRACGVMLSPTDAKKIRAALKGAKDTLARIQPEQFVQHIFATQAIAAIEEAQTLL